MMKTYSTKPADIKREWHVIDISGKTLGREASQIARLLMGKHKPIFSPNQDTGDYVVVINAEKVGITGNKAETKFYYWHSGYPGGFKSKSLGKMMQDNPVRVIQHAVGGMLPHSQLGDRMRKRLRVYVGEAHPYQGQVKAGSTAKG